MAVGISWAMNLLRRNNENNNIRELREDIAYQRDRLYTILAPLFFIIKPQIHNIRPNENEKDVFLFGDGFGWRMESNNGNYKVYHGKILQDLALWYSHILLKK